ncbi:SWM_repeat domain-containing protein [Campylobacter pinnipediorum subsp. pinnipediorum]|uniref:retention module-containing protein n=1 Tax=Campylobacter pinnipediorum TaxID=1965231 RepID=UPI000995AFAC|nr:retention module-containing protein [Campylobacter pinnipediorum]AQW85209.1 SWM_repeat domain-containing protein [Campylobacter pinnipediorum subsp. pinnipediorum]
MATSGIIIQLVGNVVAIDATGKERVVQVGDEVVLGEVIKTIGESSKVTISTNDDKDITLLGNDTLSLDNSVTQVQSFGDDAIADANSLQQAILSGADLTQLEETAAGGDSAAGDGGEGTGQLNDSVFAQGGHESNVYADYGDLENIATVAALNTINGVDGGRSTNTDNTPPVITINAISNNHNTITGTTEPNTKVVVTFPDGTIETVQSNDEGKFTVPVKGRDLNENDTVKAEATDGAGNKGEDTTDITDGTAPNGNTTKLIIDDITADNVLNAKEASENIKVTGKVTGEFKEGDKVIITVDNTPYETTVDRDGNFVVSIPGEKLANESDKIIDGKVIATDEAGNKGEITATKAYGVDTVIPGDSNKDGQINGSDNNSGAPVVTITGDVNNDGFINAKELTDTITVKIDIPANTEVGDTLVITNPNGSVDKIPVTEDIINKGYTKEYPKSDFPEGVKTTVSAKVVDPAGNESATGTDNVIVDTTAPNTPTVEILDSNNIININEANNGVKVKVTLDKPLAEGEKVNIKINGEDFPIIVKNGEKDIEFLIPSDKVPTNNTPIKVTATVIDNAGNKSKEGVNQVDVDTTPLSPKVTENENGTINIDIDTDKAGDAQEAVITYTPADSNTPVTATISKDSDGNWTSNDSKVHVDPNTGKATINPEDIKNDTDVSVVATDKAGNISDDSTHIANPVINIVVDKDEITEGNNATYTATLNKPLSEDKTLIVNFNNGRGETQSVEITIPKGKTSVKIDLDTNLFRPDDVYKESQTNVVISNASVKDSNIKVILGKVTTNIKDDHDVTDISLGLIKVSTITSGNINNNNGLVTVIAKNEQGVDITNENGLGKGISHHIDPEGFGVKGDITNPNSDGSTGHPDELQKGESLEFGFKKPVFSLDVALSWRAGQEHAKVEFYDDNGTKLGSALISGGQSGSAHSVANIQYFDESNKPTTDTKNIPGGSDSVDPLYAFTPGYEFSKIKFTAPEKGDDYLINKIVYKEKVDITSENIETLLNSSSKVENSQNEEHLELVVTTSNPPHNNTTVVNVNVNGEIQKVHIDEYSGIGKIKGKTDLKTFDANIVSIEGDKFEATNIVANRIVSAPKINFINDGEDNILNKTENENKNDGNSENTKANITVPDGVVAGDKVFVTIDYDNGTSRTGYYTIGYNNQGIGEHKTFEALLPVVKEGVMKVKAYIKSSDGTRISADSDVDTITVDLTPPELTLNTSDDIHNNTPTIKGATNLPNDSKVNVVIVDSDNNSQTIKATVKDGHFSVAPENPLADGGYTVTATATDEAHNTTTAKISGNVDAGVTLTITAPETEVEGDQIPYTFTLSRSVDTKTTVDVQFVTNDGKTMTRAVVIEAGKTEATVNVASPRSDNPYHDSNINVGISNVAVTSDNRSKIIITKDRPITTIVDDDDPTTVSIALVKSSEITIENIGKKTSDGVTVKAISANGYNAEISTYNDYQRDGFGVDGENGVKKSDFSGDIRELQHGESLEFTFPKSTFSLDVSFAWRNGSSETAKIIFKDAEGKEKGSATISGGENGIDDNHSTTVQYYDINGNKTHAELNISGGTDNNDKSYTFAPGYEFKKAEFTAPNENDDYLIHKIVYKEKVIDNETIKDLIENHSEDVEWVVTTSNPPHNDTTVVTVDVNGTTQEVRIDGASGIGKIKDMENHKTFNGNITKVEGHPFESVKIEVKATPTDTNVRDTLDDDSDAVNVTLDGIITKSTSITVDTVTDKKVEGITLTAEGPYGESASISTVKNTEHDGFGVEGDTSRYYDKTDSDGGADSKELGYLADTGSEKIILTLKDNQADSIQAKFAWKNSQESAKIEFYRGDELVGEQTITGENSNDRVDETRILRPEGKNNNTFFDKVVFSAPNKGDDYLINEIKVNTITIDKDANITKEIIKEDGGDVILTVKTSVPPQDKYPATAVIELNNGVKKEVVLDEKGEGIVKVKLSDIHQEANAKDFIINAKVIEIKGGNLEDVNLKNANWDQIKHIIDSENNKEEQSAEKETDGKVTSLTEKENGGKEGVSQSIDDDQNDNGSVYKEISIDSKYKGLSGEAYLYQSSISSGHANHVFEPNKDGSRNKIAWKGGDVSDEKYISNAEYYLSDPEKVGIKSNASFTIDKLEANHGNNRNYHEDLINGLKGQSHIKNFESHEHHTKEYGKDTIFKYSGTFLTAGHDAKMFMDFGQTNGLAVVKIDGQVVSRFSSNGKYGFNIFNWQGKLHNEFNVHFDNIEPHKIEVIIAQSGSKSTAPIKVGFIAPDKTHVPLGEEHTGLDIKVYNNDFKVPEGVHYDADTNSYVYDATSEGHASSVVSHPQPRMASSYGSENDYEQIDSELLEDIISEQKTDVKSFAATNTLLINVDDGSVDLSKLDSIKNNDEPIKPSIDKVNLVDVGLDDDKNSLDTVLPETKEAQDIKTEVSEISPASELSSEQKVENLLSSKTQKTITTPHSDTDVGGVDNVQPLQEVNSADEFVNKH